MKTSRVGMSLLSFLSGEIEMFIFAIQALLNAGKVLSWIVVEVCRVEGFPDCNGEILQHHWDFENAANAFQLEEDCNRKHCERTLYD
jgi:hypothetical protein